MNLCALVCARLQLAQIEVEESVQHALQRLGWLIAATVSALLALQFGALYLLLRLSDEGRLWMLSGFAITFLSLAVIAALAGVHMARTRPLLWTSTQSEVTDDLDALWRRHDSR